MTERPRFSVFIAASVDGFIAREDGALDWLDRVQRPGEDYGYAAFFASIDALVVGRSTWEVVRGFSPWPWKGKRVVVLSHRPLEAEHGEERHEGEVAPLVGRLAREGCQRVYVDGGAVIRQFLEADLVDDVTLSIVPILLGAGIPLFGASRARDRPLRLVESRAFESGLVQVRYGREGAS